MESCEQLEAATRRLDAAPVLFDQAVLLNASPEIVFGFVTDFERLPEWMPLIRSVGVDNTRAHSDGEVGSVRVIQPVVGRETLEVVREFIRPSLLAYSATDDSLRGLLTSHTSIILVEADNGGTRVRWRTCGVVPRNPILRGLGRLVFSWVIRRSLQNLRRHFPPT